MCDCVLFENEVFAVVAKALQSYDILLIFMNFLAINSRFFAFFSSISCGWETQICPCVALVFFCVVIRKADVGCECAGRCCRVA
jgi:hypothetical protein